MGMFFLIINYFAQNVTILNLKNEFINNGRLQQYTRYTILPLPIYNGVWSKPFFTVQFPMKHKSRSEPKKWEALYLQSLFLSVRMQVILTVIYLWFNYVDLFIIHLMFLNNKGIHFINCRFVPDVAVCSAKPRTTVGCFLCLHVSQLQSFVYRTTFPVWCRRDEPWERIWPENWRLHRPVRWRLRLLVDHPRGWQSCGGIQRSIWWNGGSFDTKWRHKRVHLRRYWKTIWRCFGYGICDSVGSKRRQVSNSLSNGGSRGFLQ